MSNRGFYTGLKVFTNFQELGELGNYSLAPEDWYVIITDVKNSTNAIYEGRYKDVNTIGAATIAAIKNGLDGEDFPYSFGGDGASILVPPDHMEKVKKELCALRDLSNEKFGLELRVGVVPIKEIYATGDHIQVAKYELAEGNCMAMFKGHGLVQAEQWIKESDRYELENQPDASTDLRKLSCRWKPIESKNGQMLCMLVQARDKEDMEVYAQFLREFSEIIPESSDHRPVSYKQMDYKGPLKNVQDEVRYGHGKWYQFSRGIVVYLQTLLFVVPWFRHKVFKQYLEDMNVHTDYRKFDNMLRMVIDCTAEQIQAVETLCKTYYRDHKVYYGIHLSKRALMTCYVEDLFKRKHMHFIDGDKGGYAMAAIPLKKQKAAA